MSWIEGRTLTSTRDSQVAIWSPLAQISTTGNSSGHFWITILKGKKHFTSFSSMWQLIALFGGPKQNISSSLDIHCFSKGLISLSAFLIKEDAVF